MKPTIVLVHGAYAESASWNGVISRLQAAGHRVIAAANPMRSLSGDAEYVSALLASIDGPVVWPASARSTASPSRSVRASRPGGRSRPGSSTPSSTGPSRSRCPASWPNEPARGRLSRSPAPRTRWPRRSRRRSPRSSSEPPPRDRDARMSRTSASVLGADVRPCGVGAAGASLAGEWTAPPCEWSSPNVRGARLSGAPTGSAMMSAWLGRTGTTIRVTSIRVTTIPARWRRSSG
jgi:hypothetical protein